MQEKIFENGIEYIKNGDYYIPNIVPTEKKHNIGKYGMLHREYLKNNRPVFYSELILTGKLNDYLYEIDSTCHERLERMIKAMAKAEGVTEKLKLENPLKWVGKMENIKSRAEETIYFEIVYV